MIRDIPPDLTRSDVGTILVSPWLVGTPERQRAAVDSTIAEWSDLRWPDAFLSLNCFLNAAGDTVLNYAQWTSDEAHREFMRTQRPALVREIDAAVADIERPGVVRYRLYRSKIAADPAPSGSVVVVTADFDGPERARPWADTALRALEEDPVSAHFHVSLDGTRVLVYAEGADDSAWQRVQDIPGPDRFDSQRYRLYRSLSRPR